MEPELITVNEAAERAGVDPRTVRRWYRKEWITKYTTRTGAVSVDWHEIEKFVRPEPAGCSS